MGKRFESTLMKAISQSKFGEADVLEIKQVPIPKIMNNTEECLIKMEATAVNRADIAQRQGNYPPPKGITDIIGLECAGYLLNDISELYNGSYKNNQRVMAILQGGGYSGIIKANKGDIMEIPRNLSFEEAAGIPLTWITAYLMLHKLARIQKHDNVLVHAAASGVGTSALQLIREYQAIGIAVCSSDIKIQECKKIGAKYGINYKEHKEFSKEVLKNCHGADIILDCIGASNFEENLLAAAPEARWVIYGFMGGSNIQNFKMAKVFSKRLEMIWTSIRQRSNKYRIELVKSFSQEILPKFEKCTLKPIIDSIYPISQIAKAHKRMESNQNIGKIILKNDF